MNQKPFGKEPRKVKQIDPDTNKVIKEFISVSEAGKNFEDRYARTKITYCCQNKQNLACGYKWQYAD